MTRYTLQYNILQAHIMTYVYSSYTALLTEWHSDLDAIHAQVLELQPTAVVQLKAQTVIVSGLTERQLAGIFMASEPKLHGDGGVITIARLDNEQVTRYS